MKHLFKLSIFILCFATILPLANAQFDSITITKHCSKDSLYHFYFLAEEAGMLYMGNHDLEYGVFNMSKTIDTLCLKKIIEYLNINKEDPKKSFSIYILYHHYKETYDLLDDSLILQTMTNNLRYGTALYGWGDVSTFSMFDNDKFHAGRYGKRLLAFGKKAIPYLQDILQDNEVVHSFNRNPGSEKTYTYEIYQLRRKDFAYFYLAKILGESVICHRSPQDRDVTIQQFIEKYRKELSLK